jgi:hypothetical protein
MRAVFTSFAAMDFWFEQDNPVRVSGINTAGGALAPYSASSSTGRELYVAPALEYNVSAALGVILGARIFAAGRNETAFVTPVIAINYVH